MPSVLKNFEAPSLKANWQEYFNRGERVKGARASDRHPRMFVLKDRMSLHALVRTILPGAGFYAEEKDVALLMTLSKADAHRAVRTALKENKDETKFGHNVWVRVTEPPTGKAKDIYITYTKDGQLHTRQFSSGVVHIAAKWLFENYKTIGALPESSAVAKYLYYEKWIKSYGRWHTQGLQALSDEMGLGLRFVQKGKGSDRLVYVYDAVTNMPLKVHHHSKHITRFMLERYATQHRIDLNIVAEARRIQEREHEESRRSSRRLEEIDEYITNVRADFRTKFNEELDIHVL